MNPSKELMSKLRNFRSLVLSMLIESDNLDFATVHADAGKSDGTIYVNSIRGRERLFRISFATTETMLKVVVRDGMTIHGSPMATGTLKLGESDASFDAGIETLLKQITEVIEDYENKFNQPLNMI